MMEHDLHSGSIATEDADAGGSDALASLPLAGGYQRLEDAILDDCFPEVDLALRRGRHIHKGDESWFRFLTEAQSLLEPFYRRYGCELEQRGDGYFFLLPISDGLSKRHLGVPEMIVGQGLALCYLDPQSVQSGGLISREELLNQLAAVMGTDALMATLNPKRKRVDERVMQRTVRQKVNEALRRLSLLGFVELLEGEQLRLAPSLMRFAEPVRGLDAPSEALKRLIERGEVSMGSGDAEPHDADGSDAGDDDEGEGDDDRDGTDDAPAPIAAAGAGAAEVGRLTGTEPHDEEATYGEDRDESESDDAASYEGSVAREGEPELEAIAAASGDVELAEDLSADFMDPSDAGMTLGDASERRASAAEAEAASVQKHASPSPSDAPPGDVSAVPALGADSLRTDLLEGHAPEADPFAADPLGPDPDDLESSALESGQFEPGDDDFDDTDSVGEPASSIRASDGELDAGASEPLGADDEDQGPLSVRAPRPAPAAATYEAFPANDARDDGDDGDDDPSPRQTRGLEDDYDGEPGAELAPSSSYSDHALDFDWDHLPDEEA